MSTSNESVTQPIESNESPSVSSGTLNKPAASAPRPTSVNAAELAISYKWDACVENSLVKTGYGLVGAGLLSLVLFRSPAARAAVTGIGAGFGAGMSWVECKQTFATNSSVQRPKLSQLQLPTFKHESQQSKQ